MCRPITCRVCAKTTWAGCGMHIQAVRQTVPAAQWCDGRHTQDEIDAVRTTSPGGFFSRIFGSKS